MYSMVLAALLTGNAVPADGGDSGVRQSLHELKQGIQDLKKEQAYFRLQELRDTIDNLRRQNTDEKINELRRMLEHMKSAPAQQGQHSSGSGDCQKETMEHRARMHEQERKHQREMHEMEKKHHEEMMHHHMEMMHHMGMMHHMQMMHHGGMMHHPGMMHGGWMMHRGTRPRPQQRSQQPSQAGPLSNRALITIEAPSGAALRVEEVKTPLKPGSTSFISPVLQPGKEYYYDVRVSVPEDGKIVTRAKRIPIRAGSRVTIAFRDMDPVPVMKPSHE